MLYAARRAIRGMAAVVCVYGVGFGDRRVFSLASGDARTCVGIKLALVFPGERGTPFSGYAGHHTRCFRLVAACPAPDPRDRAAAPRCRII